MHFGITRIMKKATKNNKEGKIEIGFTHINKKYTFFKMPQLSWQDTLVFVFWVPLPPEDSFQITSGNQRFIKHEELHF